MKFLAVGDFHGSFPSKLRKVIQKEKIDLVVSNGDYFPFYYRKLWFKHCFAKETMLWEVVGKKRYQDLVLKDLKAGEKAISHLNSLSVPVISVYGNIDYTRTVDSVDYAINKNHYWAWDEQNFFLPIIRKYPNIHEFTYSYFKFGEFIFIGAYGGTAPGRPGSKNFRKHKKVLDKLFNKFKKENKAGKVIFVSHNVPYNTKLDKIGQKAHKLVRGKHYGSKLVRRVIDQHQPLMHIGGHIHEACGTQKVGKTLCLNPGAVHEGHAAIVEVKNGHAKVRLLR